MITIIADTQHIAKRYARIVGACDEDTHHYVGNNYAVIWLEGIDMGVSPELCQKLDRLSTMELPFIPDKYRIVLLPQKGWEKPDEKTIGYARILSRLIADSIYVYLVTSDLQATLQNGGPMLVTVPKGFLYQLPLRSLSSKGIRESIQNRILIRGVRQKYEQVLRKQEAAWLISANATHLLEKVYGKGSHLIDRIATPMLSLICRRYKANKEHEPRSIYQVNFSIKRGGEVYKFTSEESFADVAGANALYIMGRKSMGEKPVIISKVAIRTEHCPSPELFSYHTILLAACQQLGFGVIHTTQCLQKLFDLGLITYPFAGETFMDRNCYGLLISNIVNNLRTNGKWERMMQKIGKRDRDNVMEHRDKRAHIGICLTERKCNPDVYKLTQDEQKVYDLIVERIILAFGEDEYIEKATIYADFCGQLFSTRKETRLGKERISLLDCKPEYAKSASTDFHWHEGEEIPVYGVSISKRTSRSIPLHTADTLFMEADLFDLGTTREKVDAIWTLFEYGYIDTIDNRIIPTEKGQALYSVVRDMIVGTPQCMGYFNQCLADGCYNKAMAHTYAEAIVRELLSSETLFARRAVPIDYEIQEKIDYIKAQNHE